MSDGRVQWRYRAGASVRHAFPPYGGPCRGLAMCGGISRGTGPWLGGPGEDVRSVREREHCAQLRPCVWCERKAAVEEAARVQRETEAERQRRAAMRVLEAFLGSRGGQL